MNKSRAANYSYFLYLIFITTYYAFRMTTLNINLNILLFCAIPPILVKLVLTQYSRRELSVAAILIAAGLLNVYITKETPILIAFITIIGFKGIKLDSALKTQFFIKLSAFFLVVFLSLLNVIPNVKQVRMRANVTEITRYALGFSHPNQFGNALFILIALYLFLFLQNRKYIIPSIVCFSLNVFQYFFTKSRTSFILITVLLVLYVAYRQFNIKKLVVFTSIFTFPTLFVLSFVLPKLLKNKFISKIDELLQYRLSLSKVFLKQQPFNLLGHHFETLKRGGMLDSGYLQLALKSGFIITLIVLVLYIFTVRRLILKEKYEELILFFALSLQAFTENVITSILFNFTFFFIAEEIFSRHPLLDIQEGKLYFPKIGIKINSGDCGVGTYMQAYALKRIMEQSNVETAIICDSANHTQNFTSSNALAVLKINKPVCEKVKFIKYKYDFKSKYLPLIAASANQAFLHAKRSVIPSDGLACLMEDDAKDKPDLIISGFKTRLDPLFLYDYGLTYHLYAKNLGIRDYILVYGQNLSFSKSECELIENFAETHHKKIICVGGIQYCQSKFIGCSPFETLAYFENADCVIANSYYGAVFSIINNKQFCVFLKPNDDSSKLKKMLENFDLSNRIINSNSIEEVISNPINYETINETIRLEREKSEEILEKKYTGGNGKLKVGIMTFHGSYNYGSMLQAYALQNAVSKFDTDVKIINFRSLEQRNMYSLNPHGTGLKRSIIAFVKMALFPSLKEKGLHFEQFLSENMNLTPLCTLPSQIPARCPKFDVYISGSDQIWNTQATDFNEAYLLPFAESGRKIAYSASFGPSGDVKDNRLRNLLKYRLEDYQSISVRENDSVRIVKNLTGRKVPVTLDPVFLLSAEEWSNLVSTGVEHKSTAEKYILFYTLYYDEKLEQTVRMMSKRLSLPVVITKYNGYKEMFSPYIKETQSGPLEFLRLLKDAKLVISSSFHGTAFSILFNKPFFAYNGASDARISTLLNLTGLSNRAMDFDSAEYKWPYSFAIDFTIANAALSRLKDESLNYLKNAILFSADEKSNKSAHCSEDFEKSEND